MLLHTFSLPYSWLIHTAWKKAFPYGSAILFFARKIRDVLRVIWAFLKYSHHCKLNLDSSKFVFSTRKIHYCGFIHFIDDNCFDLDVLLELATCKNLRLELYSTRLYSRLMDTQAPSWRSRKPFDLFPVLLRGCTLSLGVAKSLPCHALKSIEKTGSAWHET